MNRICFILFLLVAWLPSRAASVDSVTSGVWTAGNVWSNGVPPAATNSYRIVSPFEVQSPSGAASFSFGGSNLTVDAGGTLRLRNDHSTTIQTATYLFTNLTVNNGGILRANQLAGVGANHYRLPNPVAFSGNTQVRLGGGWFFTYLSFLGGVTGNGTIDFNRNTGNPNGDFRLSVHGTSNAFSGSWVLSGSRTTIFVQDAGAMGDGLVTANPNMMLHNTAAGGLDPIRGITLNGNAQLLLTNAWRNAGAFLHLGGTATLELGGATNEVRGLSIAANPVLPGVYSAASLSALGFGGNFGGAGALVVGTPGDTHSVTNGQWDEGATWSNGLPANVAFRYRVEGDQVHSPNGAGARGFSGRSLTVASNGVLRLRNDHNTTIQTVTYTIPDLVITNGGTLQANQFAGVGANDYRLAEPVTFHGDTTVLLGGGFFFSYLTFAGGIQGDGTINFNRNTGGANQDFRLNLHGVSNAFSGHLNLSGQRTTVNIHDAGAIGTGSANASQNITIDNLAPGGLDSLTNLSLTGTGALRLTAPWFNESAAFSMATNSALDLLGGPSSVLAMTIEGNPVPAGAYNASQLMALGFGGTFTGPGILLVGTRVALGTSIIVR